MAVKSHVVHTKSTAWNDSFARTPHDGQINPEIRRGTAAHVVPTDSRQTEPVLASTSASELTMVVQRLRVFKQRASNVRT